jgi:predicted PurR-regulated permease PerM
MNESLKFPFYVKASLVILGTVAFFYVLHIGQDIISPLIFSTLLAILLNPMVEYVILFRVHRIIAIILVLITVIFVLGALCYFIGIQISMFTETLPQLKDKFLSLFQEGLDTASNTFNISDRKANEWIGKMKTTGISSGTEVVGKTLLSVGGILAVIVLLPVYTFFILFYKSHLRQFISKLFQEDKQALVSEVLKEVKSLVQKYLVGLLFEALLVAILNAAALMMLGVQYAILIGILGALLNIIPYIGGLIAIAIPMIIAFATQSPITALWVMVAYTVIQFIDNNLIVPKVVASKVQINGLLSIIVVLIGGALWGVSGMFLAIPVSAIFKVIFDRIDQLKPLGFLLGDPEENNDKLTLKLTKESKHKKAAEA